ncbi:hypothetical protein HDU78_007150 [Chytriomyces hyalinus]|nr:hypothetical protein HDU78_007150 [Chytriomyces hyalinus]
MQRLQPVRHAFARVSLSIPHRINPLLAAGVRWASSDSNSNNPPPAPKPTPTPAARPAAAATPRSNSSLLLMNVIRSIATPTVAPSGKQSTKAQEPQSSFPSVADYQPRAHIVHVKSSRNNTIASLTDYAGNAIVWASAGTVGMKKSNRGSSDAGYQAVMQLEEKARKKGLDLLVDAEAGVELRLNGFGPGREMAFRAIRAMGWNIRRVSDVTPLRHAGCRAKRKRRL